MAKEKIVYETKIKSLSVKSECDGLSLEGKEFTSDERDTLIGWAKESEVLKVTLEPFQRKLADLPSGRGKGAGKET